MMISGVDRANPPPLKPPPSPALLPLPFPLLLLPARVPSAPEWRKPGFELQMSYFHFWLAFLSEVTSLWRKQELSSCFIRNWLVWGGVLGTLVVLC